jgi:hypothetical protein
MNRRDNRSFAIGFVLRCRPCICCSSVFKITRASGDGIKEWVSVLRAADAAARWHVHQRRKESAQEPFINHSRQLIGTGDRLVLIQPSSLPHFYTAEDQNVTSETIASAFGKQVADIVMEVTDDKYRCRVLSVFDGSCPNLNRAVPEFANHPLILCECEQY